MKSKLLLLLAFALPLIHGCSSTSISGLTNLGSVDVGRSRETHHYALSGGRECQLTFTPLANDEVLVEAVILHVDTAGNTTVIARPRKQTQFAQKTTLPIGNGNIVITPRRL